MPRDGSPIAVLVNYACHAVVLGPENLQYSADYPGEMARTVEAAYPGAVCLFVQGGAGNINPYYDKTPLIEDAVGVMRETGRTLGSGSSERVAEERTTHAVSRIPSCGSRARRCEFQARWDHDKVLAGLNPRQMSFECRGQHLEAPRAVRIRRRSPLC